MYLTAIRNISEFPEFILDLFNSKGSNDSASKLFKKFQLIHFEYCSDRKHLTKYSNISGHGLIYRYAYDDRKLVPITLQTFKKNLNNKDIKTVQNHFIEPKQVFKR